MDKENIKNIYKINLKNRVIKVILILSFIDANRGLLIIIIIILILQF